MIYYGMEPNPSLSAKMIFCENELAILNRMLQRPSKEEKISKKLRNATGKGYYVEKRGNGPEVFKSQVEYKGKIYPLGRYKNEEEARAVYVEAIDKINEETFLEWHGSFALRSYKKHKENYKAA